LLTQLPYIQPITLQNIKQNGKNQGLQYMPPPQTKSLQQVEIVA